MADSGHDWDLFDLERDPLGLRSAHADAEYADIVREWTVRLQALRAIRPQGRDPFAFILNYPRHG